MYTASRSGDIFNIALQYLKYTERTFALLGMTLHRRTLDMTVFMRSIAMCLLVLLHTMPVDSVRYHFHV